MAAAFADSPVVLGIIRVRAGVAQPSAFVGVMVDASARRPQPGAGANESLAAASRARQQWGQPGLYRACSGQVALMAQLFVGHQFTSRATPSLSIAIRSARRVHWHVVSSCSSFLPEKLFHVVQLSLGHSLLRISRAASSRTLISTSMLMPNQSLQRMASAAIAEFCVRGNRLECGIWHHQLGVVGAVGQAAVASDVRCWPSAVIPSLEFHEPLASSPRTNRLQQTAS